MSVKSERQDRNGTQREEASHKGLPAIGLEAEFTTVVDGIPQKPEDVFQSPRKLIRGPMVHRTGRSYHLPTGAAVYFDSGVMELATPMVEIAPACGARATRSLWDGIGFLRAELDAWEASSHRSVNLVGFSTHYNVSFDVPGAERANGRSVEALAYLLTHVLAAPVMLLASNRRSTGVGVRPRGRRVEVTADFTPDASMMTATASLIVAITREVMTWPDYSLSQLAAHGIPAVTGFAPMPHSSRKGWVAKHSCYAVNPFTADIDDVRWAVHAGERVSLREMAARTMQQFWPAIRAMSDTASLKLMSSIATGRRTSLLELDDRPAAYDNVGRLCTWSDTMSGPVFTRSRLERVLGHAIAGRRLRIDGSWHRPVRMRGWTHVVFRREADGIRHVRSLEDLLGYLEIWDRVGNRRKADRPLAIETVRGADIQREDHPKSDPIAPISTLEFDERNF